MIKGNHGGFVRGKTQTAQFNGVLAKVLAHNVCMMCHTSAPVGIAPSRHSITRSSSAPRRSANSSHDRPASSMNRSSRSPKSSGKSSGEEPSPWLHESLVPPAASGNHYHLVPIIFLR